MITFAVAFAIWRDHGGATEVYGRDTPARRILSCVYGAIGIVSLYALLQLAFGNADTARAIGQTLFPLQIVYKLMTAVALWVLHPVVMANLGISALLALTLLLG